MENLKHYEIVRGEHIPTEKFMATEDEANLIWRACYDTNVTELRELKLPKAEDFIFTAIDDNAAEVYMPMEDKPNKFLFQFYQNDKGDFIVTDEDTGEDIGRLDVEVLKGFNGFIELAECSECNGEEKTYIDTAHDCSRPISDCCGGCGHYVACECENKIFEV